MTLALTLVASYGGPDSNSYVTQAEANSLNALYAYETTIWNSATSAQQIAALLRAARDIDAVPWRGDRLFYDQRLDFPRTDADGEVWPWNSAVTVINTFNIFQTQMQDNVKLAQVLQAIEHIRNGGRNVHQDRQTQGIVGYSESIHRVSESYQYGRSGGTSVGALYPEPAGYLAQYKGSRRLYRA